MFIIIKSTTANYILPKCSVLHLTAKITWGMVQERLLNLNDKSMEYASVIKSVTTSGSLHSASK